MLDGKKSAGVDPSFRELIVSPPGVRAGVQAWPDRQCLVSATMPAFAAISALAALSRPISALGTNGATFWRVTTAATSGIADELGGTLLFCLVRNFIDSR